MINILAIYDESAPSYHRIFVPLSAMQGVNIVFTNHIGEKSHIKSLEGFNVVFVNRMFPANLLTDILQQRDKYGFRLVVDLDDHWDLDPTHVLYDYYKKYNLSNYILEAVKNADAVSVTHENLGKSVMPYNQHVWVLPNAIDYQHPQFNIMHQPAHRVRLFWAGGNTHEKDINILKNPIKRICADPYLKNKCMMVMGGYQKYHAFIWDKMVGSFTNGLQMPGVVLNGRPITDYYSLYQYSDITLIPLVQNKFNAHKSNLKILESANMGIPVIASNVEPYCGFPDEIVNYVNSQQDWYRHVRRLVRDRDFAAEQGAKLHSYCSVVYNFDKINKARWMMLTGSE